MKKKFLPLFAVIAVVCSMMLVSCHKSNAKLIEDYRDVTENIIEVSTKGDFDKLESLLEESMKISEELNERELTAEERAEIVRIDNEALSKISSKAFKVINKFAGEDVIDNAFKVINKLAGKDAIDNEDDYSFSDDDDDEWF